MGRDPDTVSYDGAGPGDLDPGEVAGTVFSNRQIRLRWAELLRRIYEVDPLVCPARGSEMRIIAFITQPSVIDRTYVPRSDTSRWPGSTIGSRQ